LSKAVGAMAVALSSAAEVLMDGAMVGLREVAFTY